MTMARDFSVRALSRITDALGLHEKLGPDGGPHLRLRSVAAPVDVGSARVFHGEKVDQVVVISLAVPPIGLDSHMIFAFTKTGSALPHFTLDAVMMGAGASFHLDLVPRVDLAACRAMLDRVFEPLTPAYESGCAIPGLSPAHLSPRQRALMSPWMLAFRATPEAFSQLGATIDAYLESWLKLMADGLPAAAQAELVGVTTAQLAQRDARLRASLFDPEIDPVWHQVTRLVGSEVSADLQRLLREPRASQ